MIDSKVLTIADSQILSSNIFMSIDTGIIGLENPELQNTFFIRYPDFQQKKVQNMYFVDFATMERMILNKSIFSSQV